MFPKTHFASFAALSACLLIAFSDAEAGLATPAPPQPGQSAAALTDETVPVFVSHEVVQPLPAATEPASSAEAAPEATSLGALVARTDPSAPLSRQLRCLAAAVYFEARGEPLEGQLAVAQVVVNRAASGSFPSSYCGVVYQRSQFSFVRGGRMPAIREGSPAWRNAAAIARIADQGLWDSRADDALYFHARYVNPGWSRTKVARATISTHVFYR